jgi:hypothetical protein
MFSVLKKWTAAGVAAAALAVTFGLASVADMAEARPAYMKLGDIKGEATDDTRESKQLAPQKRVSPAQMRRILRNAKPLTPAEAKLAQKRPTPPPPGAPGSYASKKPPGGVVKGITCSLGLCFCSGASHCNVLIAACVEVGGTLNCNEHDKEGRPTGCSCFK